MANNRTRRKALRAVAAARGSRRDRTAMAIAIAVVVVLAAAVTGGVWYQKHRSAQAAQETIPAQHATTGYPTTFDPGTGTVLVGRSSAAKTVDAYEDFLCPICGEFERGNFTTVEEQLAAGTIKVRYHLLDLLDQRSNPPGYSTLAADTALAVAAVDPGEFLDFHKSLFFKQPTENGPGWTPDQLLNLAGRLGVAGGRFTSLVQHGTYAAKIRQNLRTAENDRSLWQGNGFGTPTVLVDGKLVNWQQQGWLGTAA